MASVKILGVKELQKHLDRIEKIDVKDAVTKATAYVHGQAKNNATFNKGYSKGHLRSSIHMRVDKTENEVVGKVYTNVEYARYVEFGTGQRGSGSYPYEGELEFPLTYREDWAGMSPEPFMYPAMKNSRPYIKKIVSEDIKLKMK